MDYAACNVVYVDRTAREERLVNSDDPALAHLDIENGQGMVAPLIGQDSSLDVNLHALLKTFSEVYICNSGESCISKLSELNRTTIVDMIPTIVLIDVPYDDQFHKRASRDARTPSPNSRLDVDAAEEQTPANQPVYGMGLLQWMVSEMQYQSLSKLFVPVAVIAAPPDNFSRKRSSSKGSVGARDFLSSNRRLSSGLSAQLDKLRTMRYLDVGAVDVLTSPLLSDRLPSLVVHAYRAHKDASKEQRALLELKRGRKRSWVGVDDQKPYAYLREAMVSGLMDGICKLGGEDEPLGHVRISVAVNRREMIANSVGSWAFSAHEFTDDELLQAALMMLQHALTMPELEKWRISAENLTGFLVASRSAYNAFVPYHNFRHVVDVLQAVFHFLVQIGSLPCYPISDNRPSRVPQSPLAALVRPFDALTLLITAIGHDVGHPGVNNAFLVTLNAPLAQLYNDRSVLESFHCAAYSQILRRHWPAAFQGVEMRKLMIDSILATDMQLHFDYMKKLGYLQEKLHANNGSTDGWNGRILDDQRTLLCSLLIKCADISNVARRYNIAEKWTMILTDEFARQASMEKDLGIPSALYAVPVREIVELGKSQIGFMNMFAIPLFQGITDIIPAMSFTVQELHQNKSEWEQKISAEQKRLLHDRQDSLALDGMFSPRTMSLATSPDTGSPRRISSLTSSPLSRTNTDNQRIKDMLSQTKFPENQANDLKEESEESPSSSVGASPSESLPTSPVQRRSSKPLPSQLQLSYATASAPAYLNEPSSDPQLADLNGLQANGLSVQPSLVTDAVVIDPPTPTTETSKDQEPAAQRSSDTTEGSTSAAGDWGSQVTSATTGKMPLSPSTQGTSIMSHDDSENGWKSASQTPTMATPSASIESHHSSSTIGGEGAEGPYEGKEALEPGRKLKKKPSRFRINSLHFWKRSKSASPSMPTSTHDRSFTGSSIGAAEDTHP
ncbi:phosphodiesterase [Coleophoma crateriformis]|uniref:Phosphodiesterase n=1 Tax=Coleophoma crateriformis TaxID=565419 RepID=A0A3D8RWH1_9HELO|nr:phosphodiesterase [Coleophoma crateriformis]